jgi:hypothetical protein
MGVLAEREFNLAGWGADKKLIEGPCGHCHRAVAFKDPESKACLAFTQSTSHDDYTEERTHYFVMGICPRPKCQEATIVYRLEKRYLSSYGDNESPELLDERIIFPSWSLRADLPDEVPSELRAMYREAATIENLSPNGSAFLARRILEQCLRSHLNQPRGRLADMIDDFIEHETASPTLIELMHDVRQFGNIAGHPARDQAGDWTTVEAAEASYTLDVVAEMLDHIHVRRQRQLAMRQRWEAKKRGEILPSDSESRVIVGGREEPVNTNNALTDDDVPF